MYISKETRRLIFDLQLIHSRRSLGFSFRLNVTAIIIINSVTQLVWLKVISLMKEI